MLNDKPVVTRENFETFDAYRRDYTQALQWRCLFVLPEWLKAWWTEFGRDARLNILSVKHRGEVIGLAPLQINGDKATFIGGSDVCDYLDFIVSAGREQVFFDALLDHLAQQGLKTLELGPLRPDSTVLADLVKVAVSRKYEVAARAEDVSLELALPASWEEYLGMLNGKQRHEVKRKLRRLFEAGAINLRVVEQAAETAEQMATFFELFKLSSDEKAVFMTDQMTSFFRALAMAMVDAKILRLYILELDGAPVAAAFCFDFNDTLHLYNSGFDPRYRELSVGLLCKVLSLKNGIERGRKKYDFLKGAETYKYRLGGGEVPLVSCRIDLK